MNLKQPILAFLDFIAAVTFIISGFMLWTLVAIGIDRDRFFHRDEVMVATLFVLGSGVILAISRLAQLISSKPKSEPSNSELLAAQLRETDERLAQLEIAEARLGDLEARLEFAERLLANQERDRIPQSPASRALETGSRPGYRTPPQRTPGP